MVSTIQNTVGIQTSHGTLVIPISQGTLVVPAIQGTVVSDPKHPEKFLTLSEKQNGISDANEFSPLM
jgi:hypothetical protein